MRRGPLVAACLAISALTLARAADQAPLRLGVDEAVLMALERNRSLRVQRLEPAITATEEDSRRAAFDPVLSAEAALARSRLVSRPPDAPEGSSRVDSATLQAALSQTLPTGTSVSIDAAVARARSSDVPPPGPDSGHVGLTVSQALLRGAGTGPNLALVRQAQIDTQVSRFELRGFTEALAAEVETAYWDHALARQRVGIVAQSLQLVERQVAETREFVAAGKKAEIEIAAGEAEIALRRGEAIDAQAELDASRLRLLALVEPAGAAPLRRAIEPTELGERPVPGPDDVESHVAVALRLRPDLAQGRLQIARGDVELVRTRNGLLPRLDLFVSLGGTGYAESFAGIGSRERGDGYELAAGLRFSQTLGSRDERAQLRRAALGREQADAALANLERLAERDVRAAMIEVQRAGAQIDAGAATVAAQEQKLIAEGEKFRIGSSTSFAVAQAQRDLVESRIALARERIAYRQALVALYRSDGSLLARRHIDAP